MFWLRLHMVTRVIRNECCNLSVDWNISYPGLIFSLVNNFFLISVGCLVSYHWNFSFFCHCDWSVCNLFDSVVSSFCHSFIDSLELSDILSLELSVIPDLLFSPEDDLVLISESGLFLI